MKNGDLSSPSSQASQIPVSFNLCASSPSSIPFHPPSIHFQSFPPPFTKSQTLPPQPPPPTLPQISSLTFSKQEHHPLPSHWTPLLPSPSLPSSSSSLRRSISEPPSSEQSKLKRRKTRREKLKDMIVWWESVTKNTESAAEKKDQNLDTKGGEEEEMEEAVCVERVGEFISVNLKCPCGKGFQLLWSGQNGFYKLI